MLSLVSFNHYQHTICRKFVRMGVCKIAPTTYFLLSNPLMSNVLQEDPAKGALSHNLRIREQFIALDAMAQVTTALNVIIRCRDMWLVCAYTILILCIIPCILLQGIWYGIVVFVPMYWAGYRHNALSCYFHDLQLLCLTYLIKSAI